MKTILLFGAGKSATVLIDYLIEEAAFNEWNILVADANREQILTKTKGAAVTEAIQLDINNASDRRSLIGRSDIVISMMPPSLHILVAEDCVEAGKHLLTASYIDENIRRLRPAIESKGLLFLCEMGLDPGIDHMSAMKLFDEIKESGGDITSFKSHCGGLVAPESDDNPWHYKISWNPKNIVLAGKAGAIYKMNGSVVNETYEELFTPGRGVHISPELHFLAYYPNRDSLSYIDLYDLHHADTFMRTTLRYPVFMEGWKAVVELGLTGEDPQYETNGLTVKDFFYNHIVKHGLEKKVSRLDQQACDLLMYLGIGDNETIINKGFCSAADVLQFMLENKLALKPGDRDMIVMLHEIGYTLNGQEHSISCSLIVKGEDDLRTAMAKTVGLPLGIAAKFILNGSIQMSGLHIPVSKAIYQPVLKELEMHSIKFVEQHI